jgi:predicted DNA-binding protein
MPTVHPRVQVTPTERSYRLLVALSKLTGKGQATIVRELLDEATPAMEMMVEALAELKKRPQQMEAAMHRLAAQAHQSIAQATLDLDTNRKPGPKPGKRGRGAANTG